MKEKRIAKNETHLKTFKDNSLFSFTKIPHYKTTSKKHD